MGGRVSPHIQDECSMCGVLKCHFRFSKHFPIHGQLWYIGDHGGAWGQCLHCIVRLTGGHFSLHNEASEIQPEEPCHCQLRYKTTTTISFSSTDWYSVFWASGWLWGVHWKIEVPVYSYQPVRSEYYDKVNLNHPSTFLSLVELCSSSHSEEMELF